MTTPLLHPVSHTLFPARVLHQRGAWEDIDTYSVLINGCLFVCCSIHFEPVFEFRELQRISIFTGRAGGRNEGVMGARDLCTVGDEGEKGGGDHRSLSTCTSAVWRCLLVGGVRSLGFLSLTLRVFVACGFWKACALQLALFPCACARSVGILPLLLLLLLSLAWLFLPSSLHRLRCINESF